jgi:transcriptional regulator GlxA family with amidase domain
MCSSLPLICNSAITAEAESMTSDVADVWFFASPGVELLDVTGPWEVLAHANDMLGRPAYHLQLVAPLGGPIRTFHNILLSGARALGRNGRAPLPHTVFVAGGAPTLPFPPSEVRLIRWLHGHHAKIQRLVSVCTGAFVLAEAGALNGRKAMTHWRFADDLRRRYPAVRVVDEGIYINDGRIWTSAGITAGIDLALALVEEDHGHAVAMSVAKELLLFLRRSGRQAQFSDLLRRQERESAKLRDITRIVLEHLDESLTVDSLAHSFGMSARNFTRSCRSQLGESPAGLVRRVRLSEAKRLLEGTLLPLKVIAARTGIGDPSTLWRTFVREFGTSPVEHRARFLPRVRRSTRHGERS